MSPSVSAHYSISLGAASLCCISPTIGLNPSVIPPNSDKFFALRLYYKILPLPSDEISRKSRSSGDSWPWSLCVLCRLTLKRAHTRVYLAYRKIPSLYPSESLISSPHDRRKIMFISPFDTVEGVPL